jgi:toxin HigB-1
MIKTIKHKGLKKFYESGVTSGIQAKHQKKLRQQLTALESAYEIEDMDLPGYKLHPLQGDRADFWSISVSGNWRLTFTFSDGNVYVLDYEDYH